MSVIYFDYSNNLVPGTVRSLANKGSNFNINSFQLLFLVQLAEFCIFSSPHFCFISLKSRMDDMTWNCQNTHSRTCLFPARHKDPITYHSAHLVPSLANLAFTLNSTVRNKSVWDRCVVHADGTWGNLIWARDDLFQESQFIKGFP